MTLYFSLTFSFHSSTERNRFKGTEQQLMHQKVEIEEQVESLEQEPGDLETRI